MPSIDVSLELVRAFEENEFDIAGLADLPTDDCTVRCALKELYYILADGAKPRHRNRERLARILLAMIRVALDHYAEDGHQEYWPYLFRRIGEAIDGQIGYGNLNRFDEGQHQARLGRWFRCALEEFNYTIPEEGQTYVGPIVFHAGIPRSSLAGAVQLVVTAVRQYGQLAVNLPYDLRAQLASNHNPPLHRNVERLLTSKLKGASQLWSSLARVVVAWLQSGDCTEELQQLPAALDPDDVRRALPGQDGWIPAQRPRIVLPRLRFDAATGEVRLTFPSGEQKEWNVSGSGGQPVEIRWQKTHLGLTAELLAPPPEEIAVEQRARDGIRRTFATRPSHWPGLWFHASTGNLEDGETIDANGLEPGRWYVLFEGTPTRWNVPAAHQVQLKWSYFSGHQRWTAWKVEVPTRTPEQTRLEWYVDDNCFYVPLARRPGACFELQSSRIASATTARQEVVEVFAESPVVRFDRSLEVTILREFQDKIETVSRHQIRPGQDWRFPVAQPGVFQLREARGVGRLLLHFAIIPDVEIAGPMYDANKERVAVEIRNASKTGEVVSTASQEKRPLQEASNEGWRVEQSTVQPTFEIGWDWCDQTIPPLTLCWPVEGLRWRILGLGEDAARWTRAPIFLSPKNVEGHDAQLEIQVPSCATLKVNEQSWPPNVLDRCAVGSGISLSLLPYGEVVSVSIDDEEPTPAVIKSDRPLISPPEVLCDDDSVLVTWTATTAYSDLVLLAWNPRDVNAEPKQFPATDVGVKIPCAELPGPICSLAVARRVRVGFTRNVLQLAGLESDPAQLQSVILNVADGKTTEPSLDIPATWTDFLHLLTLSRLNGSLPGALQIHEWLKVLEGDSPPTLEELLNLDEALNKCDSPFESDWRVAVHQFLTDQITNAISKNPSRVFASETGDGDELLKRLFRLGIPIGQHCPFKWLRDVPDPIATHDTVYPFSFMRDLWLLGTRAVAELFGGGAKTNGSNPSLDDICTEAAERVRNFLNKHDLRFLLELLPMRRGTAFVNSEEGHKHSFSFTCPNIDNVHDFLELLGWDNKGIDCDATADDQFWRLQGSNNDRTYRHPDAIRIMAPQRRREWQLKYSLYWDHEEMQWYIERPVEPLPTCCSAEILHVAKFSIDEVIERLDLQQKLNQGANVTGDRTSNQEPVSVPELFTRLLRDDPVTGQLHERLLAALGDTPKVAWQIAWMERLCAWNLLRNVSSNDKSVVQRKLLELLIKMCDCWPELMRRCLATVEFLIWTLYRGGLGIAMRFASDDDVR